jgi:hypothetical protein
MQEHETGFTRKLETMRQVYGLALPARMQIEAQIVNTYVSTCLAGRYNYTQSQ